MSTSRMRLVKYYRFVLFGTLFTSITALYVSLRTLLSLHSKQDLSKALKFEIIDL